MYSGYRLYNLCSCSWHCCVADVNYESGAFDVTFGVGDTSAEIFINITEDFIDEESEAFGVVLKRTEATPDLLEIVKPLVY